MSFQHPEERRREALTRRGLARIWMEQRPRAWWWALGLVAVLLLILLWLYALPPPAS